MRPSGEEPREAAARARSLQESSRPNRERVPRRRDRIEAVLRAHPARTSCSAMPAPLETSLSTEKVLGLQPQLHLSGTAHLAAPTVVFLRILPKTETIEAYEIIDFLVHLELSGLNKYH